ncbi:MAG: MFS transporter [Candidatus Aenigmarchaeota archaeon]|nr:MFS transporter [Candidatus Aenigmarchaeota archaeon]
MKNSKYTIIFIIIFLDLFGAGLILPLLPFYAEKFTASAFTITMLVSAYSLMQFVFAPILGHLSDKYGRRPILIISQIGSAIGYFMLAFASSIYILFASRIIDGITGGNISTAQAYISDVSSKKDRKKAFGIVGAAFGLGFILGPTIGGLLGHINIILPGIFAALAALSASLLVFFKLPEARRHKYSDPFKFKEMFTVLKNDFMFSIFATAFLFSMGFASMQSVLALYTLDQLKFQERENGLLFGYIGLVAVIMQLVVLRKMEKKFNDNQLLKISILASIAGFVILSLLPFISLEQHMFITELYIKSLLLSVGITLIAFSSGIFNPVIRAVLTKNVKNYGKYLGILSSYISLTMIISPLIAGFLFEHTTVYMPFLVSCLFGLLALLITKQR